MVVAPSLWPPEAGPGGAITASLAALRRARPCRGHAQVIGHQFVDRWFLPRRERRLRAAHRLHPPGRQRRASGPVAQDRRADEHHQVGLHVALAARLEQFAQQRHVAQQRHLFQRPPLRIVEQAAQRDDLAIAHRHRGADLALVDHQFTVAAGNRPGDRADLLPQIEPHRLPGVDLRRYVQLDSHVLALDRAECPGQRIGQRFSRRHRDFLAEQDRGRHVVVGDDMRGGQHVGIAVGPHGIDQRAEKA
jgi:hypothetical protein